MLENLNLKFVLTRHKYCYDMKARTDNAEHINKFNSMMNLEHVEGKKKDLVVITSCFCLVR